MNQLYNKYFDTYKKKYDSEKLNEKDEKFFDLNQFKILGKKKQKSKWAEEITERESTEKILREMPNQHGLK